MELHPQISFRAASIAAEQAPLLVIDQVTDAGTLIEAATSLEFTASARYYPGIARSRRRRVSSSSRGGWEKF